MTTTGWWLLSIGLGLALGGYVLYPATLVVLAGFRPKRVRPRFAAWPGISITIPVYNEERSIGATLENVLAAHYEGPRQVLVVSDASTDGTDRIVQSFANRGVELLRQPMRAGKTAAENAAGPFLRYEIVVNTDASVRISPDALPPLVAALGDTSVGIASGRDVSIAAGERGGNVGESGYVGYEMWVRDLETRTGGIVGASGCFYAARRDLHLVALPEELSRDFAAPLIARERGYRAVSVRDAVCYVPRTRSLHREFLRKARTMTRGLETLFYMKHLLNPLRYGGFAWKLLSHKLLRWLVPPGLLFAAVGASALAVTKPWARVVVAFGTLCLLASVAGWRRAARDQSLPRLLAVPAYGAVAVVAGLVAWYRAINGYQAAVWEPTPRAPGM